MSSPPVSNTLVGTVSALSNVRARATTSCSCALTSVLPVGNEPDHYGGGSRVSGWSSADYTAQFLGWTSFLMHNLSLPESVFQACSFAEDPINGEDFTTANTIDEGILGSKAVKLFNQHMYQYSTCDPARNAIATLPNLVNHTNITARTLQLFQDCQARLISTIELRE